MNKVIIRGNIANDIEKSANRNGDAIINFNVAAKREFKNNEGKYDADFIRCTAFGNNADVIYNNFRKGSGILIDGKIRTGSYERDGEKIYTTDVVVERFEFIDKKPE